MKLALSYSSTLVTLESGSALRANCRTTGGSLEFIYLYIYTCTYYLLRVHTLLAFYQKVPFISADDHC